MDNEKQFATIPPRDHVIFFVLDPSAGCNCTRINNINRALSEAVFLLRDIQDTCREECTLKLAVLEAGMSARWYSDMPVPVDDFEWRDLELGFGPMNWKSAVTELSANLSRHSMLRTETMLNIPTIIFITNSTPYDWDHEKKRLQSNKWFQHSLRIAITEDDYCAEALAEIIPNPEACCKLDDINQLDAVLSELLRQATTYITIGPNPYKRNANNTTSPRSSPESDVDTSIVCNPAISSDIWGDGW